MYKLSILCMYSEWQCPALWRWISIGDWILQDWSLAQDKISGCVNRHPLSTKLNSKTRYYLKIVYRIHEHLTNLKTHSPTRHPPPHTHPFYVDVINICSLCYGKCITQIKDGHCFINFWNQFVGSYTIYILETRHYWIFLI